MARAAEVRREVKTVAQERKYPRAMRALNQDFHLDDKGKPLKDANGEPIVATRLTFRVAPFKKVEVFIDRELNEHRRELEQGELDWSSGSLTVGIQFFDVTGELICIACLSHDKQLAHLYRHQNHSYKDGKIVYGTFPAKTSNCYVPRYNIMSKKPAAILAAWQDMADSPDAFWIDGACPTQEQVEAQTKEWEERRNAKKGAAQTDTPNGNLQPTRVADDEGEEFNDTPGDDIGNV